MASPALGRLISPWTYQDRSGAGSGKQPIYTKTTDKRILNLLDKSPPQGFARWTGPLLAEALGDVDVQYVWRFLRSHKIDLAARKSWCESNDPNFTALDPPGRRWESLSSLSASKGLDALALL
jgi:hypothetical protein